MCQLLETIRVRNNRLENLDFHNARLNYSRKALLHVGENWDLSEMINIPGLNPAVTYRCRFLYSRDVDLVEFLPYTPRFIDKLYMVPAKDIDYSFKYADRKALENLRNEITNEPNADILIISDGLVTDTTFSNIAFYDGTGWVTPAFPLLNGTKRAYYLQSGVLREKKITPRDVFKYGKARLINSMLDLESETDIVKFDV